MADIKCSLLIAILLACTFPVRPEAKCPKTCDLALGSYYISDDPNLYYVASRFGMTYQQILPYNSFRSPASLIAGERVNVNFSCDCINNSFLGHTFHYIILRDDTYYKIARTIYANLTNIDSLTRDNSYPATKIPQGAIINVTVNCSCGNPKILDLYGLFVTYPLQANESLTSVAKEFKISTELLQKYNSGANFSYGNIVYVPTHDPNGSFRTLKTKRNISSGAIAGIVIAIIAALLISFFLYYCLVYKKNKDKKASLVRFVSDESSIPIGNVMYMEKSATNPSPIDRLKSVEFSYEELSKATDDFSLANKIGQGGFGAVYYAELRGEKAAIKKMETKASHEFLAELKVLTNVHHFNLVCLIGYCIEGALFLVYEFIENGNLSQHLRGSGWSPLTWADRVQTALDVARGLEYIHEHTMPVYIHRDIKSANILIDKNHHAKVADFGLTKLTEVGSMSLPTRLVGTFGYMPPEYARCGGVSPKVDVYAFGVVLYELISAKEAIVRSTSDSSSEYKGLVGLFDDALSKPDPKVSLTKFIDPKLGDSYPIDSVFKLAQLAKACTQDEPRVRPSMRSVVVALMTLSSASEFWDGSDNNPGLANLMSGR